MTTDHRKSLNSFILIVIGIFVFLPVFSDPVDAQRIKWDVPEEEYLVYKSGDQILDPLWYEVNGKRPDPRFATSPERVPFYMSLFLPNRSIQKPSGDNPTTYSFKRKVPLFNPTPPGLVMVKGKRLSDKTIGDKKVLHLRHKITFKNKVPNQSCEKCEERNRPYYHAKSGSVTADIYYDPELKGLRKISYDADLQFASSFGAGDTKEIKESKTYTLKRHHKIGSNNFDSRVKTAVNNGVEYLLDKINGNWSSLPGDPYKEGVHVITLLTLLEMDHEKTSRNSELIKKGMRKLYDKKNFKMPSKDHRNTTRVLKETDGLPMKFTHTYNVALAMMAMDAYYEKPSSKMSGFAQELVEGDNPSGKKEHQPMRPEDRKWMVKAMKWLAKNQNEDGRWGYGEDGGRGDNSNTQYGALGMYSALKSRMTAPPATLKDAIRGWLKYQEKKGPRVRMSMAGLEEGSTGVMRQGMARGWSYSSGEHPDDHNRAYDKLEDERIAMTAGGVGSLQIYEQYLRKMNRLGGRVKQAVNRAINDGLAWMSHNWTLRNVNYYELYALERAGMISQHGTIGGHKWYPEGAELILTRQKEDGSWSNRDEESRVIANVCFALLFLKRATSPIVTTPK